MTFHQGIRKQILSPLNKYTFLHKMDKKFTLAIASDPPQKKANGKALVI